MVCQLIQDHPRRCGENKEAQAIKVLCTGSPPQVRGKLCQCSLRRPRSRITPAGAGKTVPVFGHRAHNRDHPRRCGENVDALTDCASKTGSPPQVRGKPRSISGNRHTDRITPAGAGKTPRIALIGQLKKDHPRRCGENALVVVRRCGCNGSPPQVRGKH